MFVSLTVSYVWGLCGKSFSVLVFTVFKTVLLQWTISRIDGAFSRRDLLTLCVFTCNTNNQSTAVDFVYENMNK